jgi:NTP pyrophosphatase (non-canonical NTP hydrolase)
MTLTELAEQVEAVSEQYATTHGFTRDSSWFMLKLQEEVGELTQAFLVRSGQARTKGRSIEEIEAAFADELADVLAHVLLMARHSKVDLDAAVDRKWLAWLRTN